MLFFKLEIEMGNDAMNGPDDLARALRRVAEQIEEQDPMCFEIRDVNGNTVGEFHYKYVADSKAKKEVV